MSERSAITDAPYGIGGWLLVFLLYQGAVLPLVEAARGFALVRRGGVADVFLPYAWEHWLIAGLAALVAVQIALGGWLAWRMAKRWRPETITFATVLIWAMAIVFVVGHPAIWGFTGGLGLRETLDAIVFVVKAEIWPLILALAGALGWTSYLNRSRRVEHTYFHGEDDPAIQDVFA